MNGFHGVDNFVVGGLASFVDQRVFKAPGGRGDTRRLGHVLGFRTQKTNGTVVTGTSEFILVVEREVAQKIPQKGNPKAQIFLFSSQRRGFLDIASGRATNLVFAFLDKFHVAHTALTQIFGELVHLSIGEKTRVRHLTVRTSHIITIIPT